jgi:hypothetical protein
VIDAGGAAAGLERPPQEDAAAAADVEQRVLGREVQRIEHGLPREGVSIVRAVHRPRAPSVRAPRDTVGHAVDPPFAKATKHLKD